jgi:hypothetical protein
MATTFMKMNNLLCEHLLYISLYKQMEYSWTEESEFKSQQGPIQRVQGS